LVKISRNKMIIQRVYKIRLIVKVDTQKIRRNMLQKLQELSSDDLERIRQAFMKGGHVGFLKLFSSGLPFGHMVDYRKEVRFASLEKRVGLIKICGFLLQTKVYLFWRRGTPA